MAWLGIIGKAKLCLKPNVPEPIRPQSGSVENTLLISLDRISENVLVINFSKCTHSNSLAPSSI
jgi:hypothetical protein